MGSHPALSGLAIAVASLVSVAHAEPRPSADAHIATATALHAEARYAEALRELEAAYALDPQPRLLYAQGQLHGLLGECTRATAFYERFLATEPSATAARLAREAIAACRPAVPPPSVAAAMVIIPPSPPPPPRPPSVPPTTRRDRLGIALVAGGGVLGLVGVLGYVSARGLRTEAAMAPTYADHLDLVERAEQRRTISTVIGIAGGLVLASGVTRLVLAPQPGGGVIGIGGDL